MVFIVFLDSQIYYFLSLSILGRELELKRRRDEAWSMQKIYRPYRMGHSSRMVIAWSVEVFYALPLKLSRGKHVPCLNWCCNTARARGVHEHLFITSVTKHTFEKRPCTAHSILGMADSRPVRVMHGPCMFGCSTHNSCLRLVGYQQISELTSERSQFYTSFYWWKIWERSRKGEEKKEKVIHHHLLDKRRRMSEDHHDSNSLVFQQNWT